MDALFPLYFEINLSGAYSKFDQILKQLIYTISLEFTEFDSFCVDSNFVGLLLVWYYSELEQLGASKNHVNKYFQQVKFQVAAS
jgi:hypothetical protein